MKDKVVKHVPSPIKAADKLSVHAELMRVNEEIGAVRGIHRGAVLRAEKPRCDKAIEAQQVIIDRAEAEIAQLKRWFEEAPTDMALADAKITWLKKRQTELRNAKAIEKLARLIRVSADVRRELKEKGIKIE